MMYVRCLGRQRRKGSEWRNEEVGKAVAEKSVPKMATEK